MPLGILGTALAGAAEAGGTAAAKVYGEAELDRMRQEVQAERERNLVALRAAAEQETHRVNAATDLANLPEKTRLETEGRIKVEQAQPRLVPEGSTLRTPGQPDYTAPKTPKPNTPDEVEMHKAYAARMNAEADAIQEGLKYQRKEGKVQLPKVEVKTDENGKMTLVDVNSGAIGSVTPGEPGKEKVTHFFGPDEPAKEPGAPKVKWTTADGQPLQNGLSDLYPDLRARAPRQVSGTTKSGQPFRLSEEGIKAAISDPEKYKLLEAQVGEEAAANIVKDFQGPAPTEVLYPKSGQKAEEKQKPKQEPPKGGFINRSMPSPDEYRASAAKAEQQRAEAAKDRENLATLNKQVSDEFEVDKGRMAGKALYAKYKNKTDALSRSQSTYLRTIAQSL